jgi:hypothetical protein
MVRLRAAPGLYFQNDPYQGDKQDEMEEAK